MTSELRVDNLKGSTTGGSISVLGEGTSATTNLQQGLCKVWCSINQDSSGHPVYDSFNVTSTTDAAAGQTRLAFTNNMGNDDYADVLNGTGQNESSFGGGNFSVTQSANSGAKSTSQVQTDCRTGDAGASNDNHDAKVIIMGDLA
jgi:hypothetical protein